MGDKKVIWITGASSGIGKALSIKFANEGWTVAASARRENLLKELNQENENQTLASLFRCPHDPKKPLDASNLTSNKAAKLVYFQVHNAISVFPTFSWCALL